MMLLPTGSSLVAALLILSSSCSAAALPSVPSAEWDCTVSASVRSPDLHPNAAFPAQARLKMNGSQCHQLVKWQVGLVLKERAVTRLRASGVDFPTRPPTLPFDEAMWTKHSLEERMDVYGIGHSGNSGYSIPEEKPMNDYLLSMKNVSLWNVSAAEVEVFDARATLMDYAPGDVDGSFLSIKSFTTHVPNTNFAADESMFEYYFLLTVKGKDAPIYYPAGKATFIPSGKAGSISPKLKMGMMGAMKSPRVSTQCADEAEEINWMSMMVPECDAGSLAQFDLEVKNMPANLIQGDGMPLTITIRRKGNGSEYPSYLSLSPDTHYLPRWALSKTSNGKSIQAILPKAKFDRLDPEAQMMRSRPHSAGRPKGHVEDDRVWCDGPDEYTRGGGIELRDVEEQTVVVWFNTTNTTLPSYHSTFLETMPQIFIKLHTVFKCRSQSLSSAPSQIPLSSSDEKKVDTDWFGDHPELDNQVTRYVVHEGLVHTFSVGYSLSLPHLPSTSEAGQPTPYTAPTALAPLLSSTFTVETPFKFVNTGVRDENEREKGRLSRYHQYSRTGRISKEADLIAGELWEEKLLKERLATDASVKAYLESHSEVGEITIEDKSNDFSFVEQQ